MELWIRSQDKNALYCVRQLRINGLDIMCLGGELLGTYKSLERALEVLDEIHSCIQTNEAFDLYSKLGDFPDDFNKKYNLVPVYQMPKE